MSITSIEKDIISNLERAIEAQQKVVAVFPCSDTTECLNGLIDARDGMDILIKLQAD